MKQKTTSTWIQHVKNFAKVNNLKYNEALRDPNLKVGYVKVERVKKTMKKPIESMMENMIVEMKSEPQKVKKEQKKKDMVLIVEEPIMQELMTVVEEPKKVRAKRQKKRSDDVNY